MAQNIQEHMEMRQVFEQFEKHLLLDDMPSEFFEAFDSDILNSLIPFAMLTKLKSAEQSPVHHPEGNVWNHTMLVVDRAASVKSMSRNPRAFMWAALLHDIGKPDTTRLRKGKLTSYNHDIVGAKLAVEFLTIVGEEQPFIDEVTALVRWHMQILFAVKSQSFANIREMKEQVSVWDAALLGTCDRLGRLRPDRVKEEENVREFLIKCGEDSLNIENFFSDIHSIIQR